MSIGRNPSALAVLAIFCPCSSLPLWKNTLLPAMRWYRESTSDVIASYACPMCGSPALDKKKSFGGRHPSTSAPRSSSIGTATVTLHHGKVFVFRAAASRDSSPNAVGAGERGDRTQFVAYLMVVLAWIAHAKPSLGGFGVDNEYHV